jgi:hypothetical protein
MREQGRRNSVDTQKWQVWANPVRPPSTPVRPPYPCPQKVIWTSPLDRSHRVDQDPYIERPIRSPDERNMTFRRSTRHPGG